MIAVTLDSCDDFVEFSFDVEYPLSQETAPSTPPPIRLLLPTQAFMITRVLVLLFSLERRAAFNEASLIATF